MKLLQQWIINVVMLGRVKFLGDSNLYDFSKVWDKGSENNWDLSPWKFSCGVFQVSWFQILIGEEFSLGEEYHMGKVYDSVEEYSPLHDWE